MFLDPKARPGGPGYGGSAARARLVARAAAGLGAAGALVAGGARCWVERPRAEPEPEPVCALCGEAAERRCAGCRAAFYCGREHQKAHWPEHSRRCRCFKLVESVKLGRHYVAIRRIEEGEIVIREEEPLVMGPQQQTPPVCLGCCAVLVAGKTRACGLCGWPLCPACKSHGPECQFTRKYKDTKVSITGFGVTHPTYKCISVVRALALRDDDPPAYGRFANLASGHGLAGFEEPREIARFVKRFFGRLEIAEDEVAKVAGILQINGHEVPITESPQLAIYDVASFLEHSCKANCSKSFTNSGGLIVRAATTIEKGEHITICYTDPLWGTENRQHHLYRTKFFECTCPRCSDPTEFKTMFDAIKCTSSGCMGYLLPKTFIAPDIVEYKCDKCAGAMSWESVNELLELVGKELASMKKDDVEACRAFLKRHAHKFHENHFYVTDVKLALAQMLGQEEGGLPALGTELISEKIVLCKKLNELLRTIVPAENRVRGLILFEMHAALAEFGRRQDRDQLCNILQESKKLLKEAYHLLKLEPDILPEGKIAKIARRNLREMEAIVKKLYQSTLAPL